jgi:hypothetical protein
VRQHIRRPVVDDGVDRRVDRIQPRASAAEAASLAESFFDRIRAAMS